MIKNMPLISIITPNYNCSRFITETIESVLAQTYSNWEMIIVDDCSSDDSYEIALNYSKKESRIKVLKNTKNSGAAFSRNSALDIAQGEYISFLDSDDLWEKEKLEKQLDFMINNNCDFSYTIYDLIDEESKKMNKEVRIPKRLSYFKYLHHCYTGCLTVMYKKEIANDIRSFLIKNNNDYGLFLQVLKKSNKALGLRNCLAHYRIRKSSISRKKLGKIKPYFQLMHDNLRFPYILVCWFLFTNILIGKTWKHKKLK